MRRFRAGKQSVRQQTSSEPVTTDAHADAAAAAAAVGDDVNKRSRGRDDDFAYTTTPHACTSSYAVQTPCHIGRRRAACPSSVSECERAGLICQRTSCRSVGSGMASPRCECEYGPGVATVWRSVYHTEDTHIPDCASSRACCTPAPMRRPCHSADICVT